ncbi:MAG: hypothetical protein ACLUOI_18265 [Eisenbergiella sp.]
MRKRVISIVCTAVLIAGLLTGCGQGRENIAENNGEAERDSVVVTMPAASEPEAGFDPAYGWGAGEHVHEPLIQSTLMVTTKDLKIEKTAADYQVSATADLDGDDRDDVKFTDGEPLTAADVALRIITAKKKVQSMILRCWTGHLRWMTRR